MTDMPGNQPPQGYPPQQYPPQPYPPQPYPPVVYPPPKKGPSALKIILIIVAIFVGLGLIGVGIVCYGVYRVAKSGNLSINTQPVTEADMGVALYPGATDKANIHMTVAGKNLLTATFLTSDSKDQVIAFYQGKLGPGAKENASSNGETFTLDKGNGETILVTVSQSAIRDSGQTQIVIVHATSASGAPAPATQGGSAG